MTDDIDEEYLASLSPEDRRTVVLLEQLFARGPHVVARFFDELFDDIAAAQGEEKAEAVRRDFKAMMREEVRKRFAN